jgi:hypothetical protein
MLPAAASAAAITLPLVALPPDIAALDIASFSTQEIVDFVEALRGLADGAAHLGAANRANALLKVYGSRTVVLLELAALCVLLMPYDDTPLNKGAVDRAIRAYATLVGGMYSAQLISERQVLDAIERYHFPLQVMRLYCAAPQGTLLLPRYHRLPAAPNTDVVPLYVAFSVPFGEYSAPSSSVLLAELALATDATAEIWRHEHQCTLLNSSVEGASSLSNTAAHLFIVWTLAYHSVEELHTGKAATALRNAWLARLAIYNLRGVALTQEHDAIRRAFRDRRVCECISGAQLRASSPQTELHVKLCAAVCASTTRGSPKADYALVYAVDENAKNTLEDAAGRKWRAVSYTHIGSWARYFAGDRLKGWRARVAKEHRASAAAFAEHMELQQSFALAKRLMYPALFIAMRASASYEITKLLPACRTDAHKLWQCRDYRETEDRVRADPRLCEKFLYDLLGGARIKRSGNAWLQVDGHLSFCIAGEGALGWVERGVRHTAEKGRGLGPLVMHCRGQRDADEAYSYVLAWWKAHTSGGSVLPLSPSRAIARLAEHSAEEDQARIAKVLSQCTAVLPGTVAHRYLRETRGLTDASEALIERNPALRAACALWYAVDDSYALDESNSARWYTAPGLVVLSEDSEMLQRIYLDAETANKSTSARPVKRTMGRMVRDAPPGGRATAPGVCVQHASATSSTVDRHLCFVAEGPETALSVAAAWPESAVYATLGASTLADFVVPATARALVVCRENDKPETKAALTRSIHAALSRLRARIAHVVCVSPPAGMKDFNDMHQHTPGAAGTAEIRACIMRQLLAMSG